MPDVIDPEDARLRALRRWDEIGFDELTVGLIGCVLGGMFLLGCHVWMIATFLMLVFSLGLSMAVKKVKTRFIFPRTGYVVFRPARSRTRQFLWIFVCFSLLAAAQIVVESYLRRAGQDFSRMWGPAFGGGFAACFAWGAMRYRMPRYFWVAGLSLLLGGITLAVGAKIEGGLWVMVGLGAAMVLDGALRMRSFLKNQPAVEDRHG